MPMQRRRGSHQGHEPVGRLEVQGAAAYPVEGVEDEEAQEEDLGGTGGRPRRQYQGAEAARHAPNPIMAGVF